MKDKKHIDSLFKDRFKSFEASPSPEVWEKIQAQLQKTDGDKKVIPLWFKLAGVAALLALLFTVGTTFFNPSNAPSPEFTTIEEVINEEDDSKKNNVIVDKKINTTEIASEDKNTDSNIQTNEDNDNLIKKSSIEQSNISESKIASENNNINNSNKNSTSSEKKNSLFIKNSEADKLIKKATTGKTATAVETNITKDDFNTKNDLELNTSEKGTESLINKGTSISETTLTEEAVTESNNSETEEKKTALEESEKPSIFDAIDEKNTVEEVVASNDNDPDNRWDITPNFAPVFYNSLEEGSSIDPSFADNAQSGDVNFSYGIQVAYNVSDKLSIRSGVNNVNLSYTTTGIELGTGPVSAALKSIDYGNKSVVLTAVDKGSLSNSGGDGTFGNITPKATNGEAELNQKINYFEVPLELKYSLVNNKFGVNLIGGLSTLFLGNNEITVNAGDFESVLGEANNLSSVSFTTNIGVGLNYKFSKRFMFNIEPMFKYQLNPYTDSSVNYKPYYIGIYSGLSFKF
ncbi:MAG: hypothetical protein ACI9SJ_001107 [Flavobacteriaceae bacterium]|jgi:hypothetical protein|uniref:outer membrane beta-barrel protein n=1 Tax=Candidatus Marifrigoribacter sp. Uisw_064 TaxID=3230970 RepID=UPI003AEDFFD5